MEVSKLTALGPEGVNELLSMLADPSWVVRRAVVAALASLGNTAVEPLTKSLIERRDDEARIAATVDALSSSMGNVGAAIEKLAQHPNPAVAADAAQILGRRRDPAAVPVLERLTQHSDDNVAVAAIEALGRVGGRAAVESLI